MEETKTLTIGEVVEMTREQLQILAEGLLSEKVQLEQERLNLEEQRVTKFEALAAEYNERISHELPEEIRLRVAAIEAEREGAYTALREASACASAQVATKIAELQAQIDKAVLSLEESVSVPFGDKKKYAIYNSPRITWDGKILEGLAIAIPEVAKARKVGKPYVSYR